MNEVGSNPPSFLSALFLASRPKTLMACVVPIWLGGVLAHYLTGSFNLYLFVFTLLPALAIQIATNFFNDAIDYKKGADTKRRLGPKRMAGTGALTPESLLIAGIAFLMVALTLSLVIVVERGVILVVIGIPSLFFTYGYTGGPFPLAYRGLGELFVFIFFGLIAVSGTVFVQTGIWSNEAFLLGGQVGMLATVLIAINNARDIDEDKCAGKRTLAVRFGINFAKFEIIFLCLAPFLMGGLWWFFFSNAKLALIPLPGMLLALVLCCYVYQTPPGKRYNTFLGLAIVTLLLFAVLFTLAVLTQ